MFTADELAEGLPYITKSLADQDVKASFFFTGNFLRNKRNWNSFRKLKTEGHYIGPHSDKHLLYCDWTNRDSLLVSKNEFAADLYNNLQLLSEKGVRQGSVQFYIPPYEWWNDSIAQWSIEQNCQVINFTPGIRSNADYTYPEMGRKYLSTEAILQSIDAFEMKDPPGLNGAIILIHAGTDPRRKDKLYSKLPLLISKWKRSGYELVTVAELLSK